MDVVAVLAGLGCIALAISDVFTTLFRPEGRGTFSPTLGRWLWRGIRQHEAMIQAAGATIVLTIIASWVLLVSIGWALIYLPFLPEGFLFDAQIAPEDRSGFVTALYLSIVTLATLGFGDIVPAADLLRLVTPVEALLGFVILTAGLTWTLSIYPVLARRRELAMRISLIGGMIAESDQTIEELDSSIVATLLSELTTGVMRVRDDLAQFPVSYYFHTGSTDADLSGRLGILSDLVEHGRQSSSPGVRFRANALGRTLDNLCGTLAEKFLGCAGASSQAIVEAYARDHGHDDIVRLSGMTDGDRNQQPDRGSSRCLTRSHHD